VPDGLRAAETAFVHLCLQIWATVDTTFHEDGAQWRNHALAAVVSGHEMCSLLPGEALRVTLSIYCTSLHNIWDGIYIDPLFVVGFHERVTMQVRDNPKYTHPVQLTRLYLLPEIYILLAASPVGLTIY